MRNAAPPAAGGPTGTGALMRFGGLARRAGAVGLVGVGVAATWHWRGVFDPLAMTALLAGNPLAPLGFIALHVAASLFFVPRTVLAIAAGLVFGGWWGPVWAALGSLAGAVAGYLVARYLYSGFVERADPTRLRALLARADNGGWRMVAVVRLLPLIPHSLTNYAFGLTRVSLAPYAIGSLLGQLPLTIAYADLGAAGGQAMLGGAGWHAGLFWPTADRAGYARAVAADPGDGAPETSPGAAGPVSRSVGRKPQRIPPSVHRIGGLRCAHPPRIRFPLHHAAMSRNVLWYVAPSPISV